MMGTLATLLAKKGIRTHKEVYRADVTGDIRDVNGILKITRIEVKYELRVPEEKREEAEEAFRDYLPECPAAQSVIGCIDIHHTLDMKS
ncbi:MAG: OsmC family protein [Syntrophobacteraceae bacterium]